jgi:hypothetical protein
MLFKLTEKDEVELKELWTEMAIWKEKKNESIF